jgi:hypothetical protein
MMSIRVMWGQAGASATVAMNTDADAWCARTRDRVQPEHAQMGRVAADRVQYKIGSFVDMSPAEASSAFLVVGRLLDEMIEDGSIDKDEAYTAMVLLNDMHIGFDHALKSYLQYLYGLAYTSVERARRFLRKQPLAVSHFMHAAGLRAKISCVLQDIQQRQNLHLQGQGAGKPQARPPRKRRGGSRLAYVSYGQPGRGRKDRRLAVLLALSVIVGIVGVTAIL